VGYFVADRIDSTADRPVFNRSATLRDTWQR
jgi:glutaminyl-tRNA synthetase